MANTNQLKILEQHVGKLKACTSCKNMIRPVVSGLPVMSKVMLIGQAPGDREGVFGKPFAWTAGKTLFKWFGSLGLPEEQFRERVYMAAVCRCFPGKNPKGGDRVPDLVEIENCSRWIKQEISLLEPELTIPVGKLAISQILPVEKLNLVVGSKHRLRWNGHETDVVPLPHPSGASTWHRMEPGKTLLNKALKIIAKHPSFKEILD